MQFMGVVNDFPTVCTPEITEILIQVHKVSSSSSYARRDLQSCPVLSKRVSHSNGLEQVASMLVCMQYAGNVLVYGAMSPCDGDWYGSVTKDNAAEFLDAIITIPVSPFLSLKSACGEDHPNAGEIVSLLSHI